MKEKPFHVSGGVHRHIEGELYQFHQLKAELEHLQQEISTGRKAISIHMYQRIEHLEKVLDSIDSVYQTLTQDQKNMMELLYWKHPRTLTWEGIVNSLPASKKQAQKWRKDIIRDIAARMGWA